MPAGNDPVQFRLAILSNAPRAFTLPERRSGRRPPPSCSTPTHAWMLDSSPRNPAGRASCRKILPWVWPSISASRTFAEVARAISRQATRFRQNESSGVAGDVAARSSIPAAPSTKSKAAWIEGLVTDGLRGSPRRGRRYRAISMSIRQWRLDAISAEIEGHFLNTDNPPTGLGGTWIAARAARRLPISFFT